MHPNDRNEFDRWIMNKSDLVYVGHEHLGRNEAVKTRDTNYYVQYGEVLQERNDAETSGFIMNYIEDGEKITYVYNWNASQEMYNVSYTLSESLNIENNNKYLCFQNKFREYLKTADIRISHPKKENISIQDLYVYPDIEAYKGMNYNSDMAKESTIVKGEEIIDYILRTKKVSILGGSKSGKTALAKNIALDFITKGKYSIIVDCAKIVTVTKKNLDKSERLCISRAYGEEYINTYRQLDLSNKILILDNFEKIRNRASKKSLLEYFDNFYSYILTFSNTTFELELLDESLYKKKSGFSYCSIKELGYKKRYQLITKWYYLAEGDAMVDDLVKNRISEAMSTIDVLKGNGYMPCIPPHILIILQQLEYSMDGSNQEKSNYGYLYEFLISKSILDMNRNCEYVHKDIAFGILTNVAKYMLHSETWVIPTDEYKNIVYRYNEEFQTDANADQYISEYSKVELLNIKEGQVSFGYPYIHYYFTAKYLSNNMNQKWAKEKIQTMSQHLHEEDCGDIMIFLCHLSKDDFIINAVLKNAKTILAQKDVFDFSEHKSIQLSFDECLKTDFIPEEDTEKRQQELLEIQDMQEDRKQQIREIKAIEKGEECICSLDNAFKTIEVMGQILKNYPGTIKGSVKNDLLKTIYNLGMRTLSYTSDILYNGIANIFNEIREKIKLNQSQIELDKIESMSRNINFTMDNLFGILSYAMIRNLASAVANKALMPVITQSSLNSEIGYVLMRDSIQLNEFGIITVDLILSEYDKYNANKNIFAARLLRLLVLDHYYAYGSKDFKSRQRVWQKMKFGNKEKVLALQGDVK